MALIRDLLTPEAQRDVHHWLATLGSHVLIGQALWLVCGRSMLAVGLVYAAWEGVQMRRRRLWWDAALDWTGVMFGAGIGAAMWAQDARQVAVWAIAAGIVAAVGAAVRG